MGRRVAIVGARLHGRRDQVEALVATLATDDIVVSGGALGVDTWAETAAKARGLETDIHRVTPEEWETLGRRAGPLRNVRVVAASDVLHAFLWWGSRGARDTLGQAQKAGLEVFNHRREPLLEVWTTRLGSRDPDELDITRMSAEKMGTESLDKHELTALLRRSYSFALDIEASGATLLDAQRSARKDGRPSLGASWAPSKRLLHEGLARRRSAAGKMSNAAPGSKDQEAAYYAGVEAWCWYEERFMEEMRASLIARPFAWGWLLARRRVVLACVCPDAERCHRYLVARALGAMGARVNGEIEW